MSAWGAYQALLRHDAMFAEIISLEGAHPDKLGPLCIVDVHAGVPVYHLCQLERFLRVRVVHLRHRNPHSVLHCSQEHPRSWPHAVAMDRCLYWTCIKAALS